MPKDSIIVGVDLAPIKPIPKVITFQSDITTDKCRATIRQHLKTWKADVVLHDGAPNVGTAWVQDSYNQAELVLQSMKLATEFLVEGGTFVTKVFRSKEYTKLLWVFGQLFTKVESTKPPSSRNVSAEIFVVCRGFKAPKRIDPRFLDPRAVFAELADPAPNNEAKVYYPEVKKRKRGGYEEGDYIQYKELPASEFIQTTDPIAILGSYNRLTFTQAKNGDVALAALDKMAETTDEIRQCCADLRVLGRKEFKNLLKWRLQVRETFGFPTKKTAQPVVSEEVAQVDSMDEETKIQQDLQELQDKTNAKKKRERRKENERKQREIIRTQLNMNAPMDIGMEQGGPMGEGATFALKAMDKTNALRRIAKGKMAMLSTAEHSKDRDSGLGSSEEADDESDEEEDRLERELDSMYDQYRERKSESDAKYRAKRARQEHGDDEWEGFSAGDGPNSDSEDELDEESGDESDSEDDLAPERPLLTDLDNGPSEIGGLSKRARSFFSQDIFKDIPGLDDEPDESNVDGQRLELNVTIEKGKDGGRGEPSLAVSRATTTKISIAKRPSEAGGIDSGSDDSDFEVVKPDGDGDGDDDDWEEQDKRRANGKVGTCLPWARYTEYRLELG